MTTLPLPQQRRLATWWHRARGWLRRGNAPRLRLGLRFLGLLCLGLPGAPALAANPSQAAAANPAQAAGADSAFSAGPGSHRASLPHGGTTRLYRVHVPASYDPQRPLPLVVSMHGGGGSMDIQADERYYGWISAAERHGFIVVFPNGYSRFRGGHLATWNAGRCCGAARDQGSDDVGFIAALIDSLRGQWAIDERRVFATGMSNGGMMAYRLACELPQRFLAIAAVAGTDNTHQCTPAQAVSVLHIHARDDERVLYDGGAGKPSRQETDYSSVADTVARWSQRNGCPAAAPQTVLKTDGALCEQRAPCRDGSAVQWCSTDGGGHSWPGGTKPRGRSTNATALDATEEIWRFFARQAPR
ncbi:extracellular catalytic domain type 1 short-chain-length polyhydroxyalkanoate depolymerase [Aquabacterium sp. OR-4]|uniref:extracellular catalytic domain type 1 short-chain-length polyhydroxyalkanoate depolymerase n=1 Tax=Aquabacterium sp. OR-4 TaxID=2978127 RepID=UPI0021B1BFED|nr:PHB depolymerase family esterase [Aquabacterium sp. OR-4]MDT7834731.1 PHB depolymerase family esterase [Aquabacterium sp. OR-4]